LRELLDGVSKAAEPLERAVHEMGGALAPPGDPAASPGAEPRPHRLPQYAGPAAGVPAGVWLRPPGARSPDTGFRDTCSRCGKCVEVCPAQCIRIDPSGVRGQGAPFIEPDSMPCVVCEGLSCMNVCPSGALQPLPLVEIDMGTAVWREANCVRPTGEECRICVERCPMGTAAIDVSPDLRGIVVHPLGCIGCGLCQHHCPTTPKAIVVIPAAARQA
jgi:ferredoxin-type protein NapG